MPSLYQIREDIDRILETGLVIDSETGEITEEDVSEKLAELHIGEEEKLENVALYIKNLAADIEAMKVEEKALADRRRTKEKKLARIREYLAGFMEFTHRSKFESARCALSFRSSWALEIEDEAALREYAKIDDSVLRYKEPEINKTAITARIKSGAEIPGVKYTSRQNLQVK